MPGPSTALDLTNSSVSTTASEVELGISYPSPSPSPGINNTDTKALEGLADLPPLPSLTHDEIEDLDPTYPNYRATIHYYSLSPSDTLTQETHPKPVSRTSVLLSLEYFYALRKHLTANLSILDTYPGTSLAAVHDTAARRSPALTALERAQDEFAMHHIAINENLRAVNSDWGCDAFGLPDPMGAASDVRHDRNYFAHTFPTPTGKGIQLEWAVKGKRDVYGGLLGLVERNIVTLEGQLGGVRGWVSPRIVEREKAERRRLEAEAREAENERRTEDTAQEEGWVYEQEGDVGFMSTSRSVFSRVFDSLGGHVIIERCFRSGLLRRAGWRLLGWLEKVLVEADTAAQVGGEEVATGEYGEGEDWESQECKIEDDECRSQEYKVEDIEGYGSQDIDAPPLQPDSGWGEPQW